MHIHMKKERALEFIRHIMPRRFWIRLDDIAKIFGFSKSHVSEVFCDPTFQESLDASTVDAHIICSSKQEGQAEYTIIGEILLPISVPYSGYGSTPALLLTEQLEVLFAVETDAAIHQDGIVQIHGAEPSVLLFTIKQLKAQSEQPKIFLHGGVKIQSVSFERRNKDGSWSPTAMRLLGDAIQSVDM